MSTSNNSFNLPRLIESKVIFEESLIKIKKDLLQIDHQPSYTYYSLMTPPTAVVILAITPEGAYVLNKEYRHPTGQVLLGCPGGYIDLEESPIAAAERELLEETGYQAQSFIVIGKAYPYAGFSGQQTIYVLAQDAILTSEPQKEVSEIIQAFAVTPQALDRAIKEGVNLDGTLCTALFFLSRLE